MRKNVKKCEKIQKYQRKLKKKCKILAHASHKFHAHATYDRHHYDSPLQAFFSGRENCHDDKPLIQLLLFLIKF